MGNLVGPMGAPLGGRRRRGLLGGVGLGDAHLNTVSETTHLPFATTILAFYDCGGQRATK